MVIPLVTIHIWVNTYLGVTGITVWPLMRENHLPIAKITVLFSVQNNFWNLWDYLTGPTRDSRSLFGEVLKGPEAYTRLNQITWELVREINSHVKVPDLPDTFYRWLILWSWTYHGWCGFHMAACTYENVDQLRDLHSPNTMLSFWRPGWK